MLYEILFVAVLVLGVGAAALLDKRGERRERRFKQNGRRIMGKVTGVDEVLAIRGGSPYKHPWEVSAEFEYVGKRYRAVSGKLFQRPDVFVGDQIVVHFMPDDPSDCRILDESIP